MTDEQRIGAVIVACVALALLLLVAAVSYRRSSTRTRGQKAAAPWTSPRRIELARIEERIEQTAGGNFCTVLLVLHQIGSVIWFAGASTVIQQSVSATLWIGGNVLWGLGVAVGRRRTYVITREAPPGEEG